MKVGAQAELAAAHYLSRHGLKLVTQNYRCRFGEIDLILLEEKTLVFAEVRLRNNNRFGGAAASIDSGKQRKLICTAQCYLSTLPHTPACRFDVVLLRSAQTKLTPEKVFPDKNEPIHHFNDEDIIWIKNAFEA